MANPIIHWEITSSDRGLIQVFYGQMFDWEIDTDNDFNYGMVSTKVEGGIDGGIGPSPTGNLVTIYVEVDDLHATLDKAERLGGKTILSPMAVPTGVSIAQFADPAGNVIGLVTSGSGANG